MQMEAASCHSQMNVQLECSVCMDVYEDPRVLRCGHTFCHKCLQRQPVHNIDAVPNIICPKCRSRTETIVSNGAINPPVNFVVRDFMAAMSSLTECGYANHDSKHRRGTPQNDKAQYFCIECCKPLCTACRQLHAEQSSNHAHVVKLLTLLTHEDVQVLDSKRQERAQTLCSHHPDRQVEWYCIQCKVPGCSVCIIKNHSKHEAIELAEADKQFLIDINEELVSLKKAQDENHSKLALVKMSVETLHTKHDAFNAEVNACVDKAVNGLKRDFRKLLFRLESFRETAIRHNNGQTDTEHANTKVNTLLAIQGSTEDAIGALQKEIALCEKLLYSASSPIERSQYRSQRHKTVVERPSASNDEVSVLTYEEPHVVRQWLNEVTLWAERFGTTLLNERDSLPSL